MDINRFFERIHPLDSGEHMFFPEPNNRCYSASELRAIADELDKRNGNSRCIKLTLEDKIVAVDQQTGEQEIISDLYWFEENGVKDWGGEGHLVSYDFYLGDVAPGENDIDGDL